MALSLCSNFSHLFLTVQVVWEQNIISEIDDFSLKITLSKKNMVVILTQTSQSEISETASFIEKSNLGKVSQASKIIDTISSKEQRSKGKYFHDEVMTFFMLLGQCSGMSNVKPFTIFLQISSLFTIRQQGHSPNVGISEIMSCDEANIFFSNLAYLAPRTTDTGEEIAFTAQPKIKSQS